VSEARAEPRPVHGGLLIAVVGGGNFLAPVNSTMIAVALPALERDFDVGVAGVSWVVIVYLLVMASLQPVAGRLGDVLGHKRLFVGGCVGLAGASVACALAPSFAALVAFRGLQAACAAVMSPNGSAIVRQSFPDELRGRAFGWLAACLTFGAAIGPALGGVLVHRFDWSAIFWVNLPVLALVVPLALRVLPEAPRGAFQLDVGGALLLTAVLGSGVAALTTIEKSPAAAAGLAATTAGLAVALAAWERREAAPIVDFRLFRHPAFSAASAGVLLSNLMMYTTLLLVPLFMSGLQGRSEARIGAVLVAYSACMAVFSPVGGHLSDRFGRALPVVVGSVLLLASTALLLRVGAGVSSGALTAALAVGAIGVGLQMGATQSAALESAPVRMAGAAGGVWATSRYAGSIIGSALLGVLLGSQPSLADFHHVLWLIAGAGMILLPVGVLLRHSGAPRGLLSTETRGVS
jgi:EmrB/QacA subfamily drug resistance transporter